MNIRIATIILCGLLFLSAQSVSAQFVMPETGHWSVVGENGPGSGVNINLQDGLLGVTVFTFDDQGAPLWYIAFGAFESTKIDAPLLTVQNGSPLDAVFKPGDFTDSGKRITIEFFSKTTGELRLDGITKPIQFLHFTGNTITIPGGDGLDFTPAVPDMSGEWALFTRHDGVAENNGRVFDFELRTTRTVLLPDEPDAPVVYVDQRSNSPLQRAYLFCEIRQFGNLEFKAPLCGLRLIENELIVEYEIDLHNLGTNRFDASIITIPEAPQVEVFALRVSRP